MVRKALSRNISTTPPPAEQAARYMRYWVQKDLYRHPERFPKLTSPALFGDERPLEMEVGCGTGEFLCALAEANPDHNFVGLDVWPKVIYEAVRTAARADLDNILFIRAPIQFTYPLFVADSLVAIYIHYPDPHIRNRGRHKILNPAFLDAAHHALVPGGRLSLVTDHDALLEEILDLLADESRFARTHEAPYLLGYDPPLKSRYQRLWEKYEVPPKRIVLVEDVKGVVGDGAARREV